jgi:hypothetical protein
MLGVFWLFLTLLALPRGEYPRRVPVRDYLLVSFSTSLYVKWSEIVYLGRYLIDGAGLAGLVLVPLFFGLALWAKRRPGRSVEMPWFLGAPFGLLLLLIGGAAGSLLLSRLYEGGHTLLSDFSVLLYPDGRLYQKPPEYD